MSFIHYLFLGHFEREGEIVRFAKSSSEAAYQPVVRCPIDLGAVRTILREVKGVEADDLIFPDDWGIWLDNGYLICNKYTRNREAIDFVSRLVERTRCDIHDFSAHCDITLRDWLTATETYSSGREAR